MSEVEILSSFSLDFCRTAQNVVHSSESSVQRSEQSISSYPWRTTKLHHQESIHHWQYDKIFHLLLLQFNGNVFTAALVSKFIITHSNGFGRLVAPRSKPPNENELVLNVSFHPISSLPDVRNQLNFSMFLPLSTSLAPRFALSVPLDFSLDFPLFSFTSPLSENEGSLLVHGLLCLTLPYDHPFPLPDEREVTASTSMGSECARELVTLGL